MKPATWLAELQNVDTRIDENAAQRAQLEHTLAENAGVLAAQAARDTADRTALQLKSELKTLELETAGLTDKLKQINERLYSGRITNAKELAGMNQDEKMLARRKGELEDRELLLMEQIDAADREAEAKRAHWEQAVAEKGARDEQSRAALQGLEASDRDLLRKRDGLRAQVPAASLAVYDGLRASKKGRAVALLKGTACGACGFEVPSGLISRVKLGDDLVTCVNCGRILAP